MQPRPKQTTQKSPQTQSQDRVLFVGLIGRFDHTEMTMIEDETEKSEILKTNVQFLKCYVYLVKTVKG